jgi:hypothetical protein
MRLGAAAVDAHLSGAQEFLQMAEAQPRIVAFEPAIEPHPRLASFHLYLFNACHDWLMTPISRGVQ